MIFTYLENIAAVCLVAGLMGFLAAGSFEVWAIAAHKEPIFVFPVWLAWTAIGMLAVGVFLPILARLAEYCVRRFGI